MIRPVRLLLSFALTAGVLSPQNSWLSTTPQQVALNVIALDSRGQPVADLTAADFTIQDENRPQRVAHFQRAGTQTRHSPSAATFSNRPNIAGSQTALVIFLDPTNQAASVTEVQLETISRTLEHLDTPEDVYLYLLAAGGKLLPVRGLPNASQPAPFGVQDWTTQTRTLLKQAMVQAGQLKPVTDDDPALRARAAFQALIKLCRDLRVLPGPQNVLWISQGTPLHFTKPTGEHADLTDQVRSLNYAFTYDQVAIHTVFEGDAGKQRENQLLLQMFAGLSGGKAYSGHDIAAPINDIMASAKGSYRLWYEPGRDNWNSKFHGVRVTCAREGVQVIAQQGYLAIPRDITEATLKRRFNLTAFAPADTADIGLRVKVSLAGKDVAHIAVTIDAGDLSLVHQGDHATDQLAIGIFGMTGGKFESETPALMNVVLSREQLASALQQGIPFIHDKNIAHGIEKIRIVVMDMSASRIGSLTVPVE